jgi:glycosyltransferase involved in cell wall biosynthesis
MKVLSLTNTPLDPSLGSGKTVLAWSQGLEILGHDVDVISPESFYRPWPNEKAKRIKTRFDAKRLSSKVLTGNYDLVEFYGAEFGLLIAKVARIPRQTRPLLVAHTNGLELLAAAAPKAMIQNSGRTLLQSISAKTLQPVLAKIDAMAFTRVDAFAAICEADMNFVVDEGVQPRQRCAVIEPGVDEAYLSAPWQRTKKPWLVSFASWSARKDPETTVRIATHLLLRMPELEFHVIGASDAKQTILSAFDEPLRSRIVVYPRLPQEDIVEVLSQAKVFLFPSLYEGFGMATTEAMACGCAVVVTPTGFGEAIRDGVDGFVCNFQDVAMMTARCSALLLDDDLRQRIAKAGRERVCRLRWSAQVQKLESQYQNWIKVL